MSPRRPTSPPSEADPAPLLPVTSEITPEEEEELYAAMNVSAAGKLRAFSPSIHPATLPTAAVSTSAASGSASSGVVCPPSLEGGSGSNISVRDSGSSNATSTDIVFDDIGEDPSKYPPSMSSSVKAHVYEGGLRYHAFRDGKYAFPNDEVEQNRDDMKHTMSLMICHGAYFYAPVEEVLEDGGEVLDLGEFSISFGSRAWDLKETGE